MIRGLSLALSVFCLVLSVQARADDMTYCAELASMYQRYLGQTGARAPLPDATAAAAMNACEMGTTAAGIPPLEKKLRDARFTLPARS